MNEKPVEDRSRQANYQRIRSAAGQCPHCGGAREPKPGGGYYRFCAAGRQLHNERQKQKMRERRQAGIVDGSGRKI